MRRLFTLDEHNYDTCQTVLNRCTVRAVILRDGKLAMQVNPAGHYKLPGGGPEQNETLLDALVREVHEETGLLVVRDSIQPVGEVLEMRADIFNKLNKFVRTSYFYLCDAVDTGDALKLTPSERRNGYYFVWATPEEILKDYVRDVKRDRDMEFIRMLPKLLEGTK